MSQVVIGLAGHIDHGKTALVEALTGVNTDRMKEEIQRGMTIDIGFAFLSETVTMIDIPGHEKFVKNMMTGVSSVDAALLVIAADDGVMPQTREHLDILNLLGVKNGIIALNKIDLAEDDWVDLVELDIHELVQHTFLENAPIIRVSAVEKTGLNALKESVLEMCGTVKAKPDRGIFRMPVDRVFTKKGFGTVITGTVSSGKLTISDTIEILPGGITTKVRGLQSHGTQVDEVFIGDRAAVNFQGLDAQQITRGCQLGAPGYFTSTSNIGVNIDMLQSASKPLKQNQRIRIHLGTQEVMARVCLVDVKDLSPGQSCRALLNLESMVTASLGDRFIVRTFSPVITIAGGEVLDNQVIGKWSAIKTYLKDLYQTDTGIQIPYLIQHCGAKPMSLEAARLKFGLSDIRLGEYFKEHPDVYRVGLNRDEWVITKTQLMELKKKITKFLDTYHQKHPHKIGAQREEIRQYFKGDDKFIEYLLAKMQKDGLVTKQGENWSLGGHSIQLSDFEKKRLELLMDILDEEGFQSSNQLELAQRMGTNEKEVKTFLDIGYRLDKIIRIEGKLLFTRENFEKLKQDIIHHFDKSDSMSVSEFKDMAGTSRKYAVPLLEYFDKLKITYRDGNNRKLVQRNYAKA